ncbi:uncharacterized protein TNCV_800591 [Trichonephila clavipes]|nr:uncharacterized protein TNCV_800591 [Trichonephila clavipes]
MDPFDAFPEHISTTVVPVTLPDKPDALEYSNQQGQVQTGTIYQEPTAKRVFVLFCKDHWHKKKTWLDNFKRAVMEAKHANEFRPNDVMWEKHLKDRLIAQNTNKGMLIQKGFHVGDFRKIKKFDQTPYKLPPPTPIHVPAEKRPLEEKYLPFSKKRSKVRITPVMRRVSRRPKLPMAPVQISQVQQPPVQIPDVSEPVQIPVSQIPQSPVQIPLVPEPPVQIPVSQVPQPPVQIPHVPEPPVQMPHVPEPPVQILPAPEPMQILSELDTLDPLESTLVQLMSFVFRPSAQELQLLHTVPSIFDGDLISFLDEFERAPMDLTMPRLNSCVKQSIGFKAIQRMDLSVNSCL